MSNTEGGSRKIIETAVEANENGDIGLHGIYRTLCHKIYPERTLRWKEHAAVKTNQGTESVRYIYFSSTFSLFIQ
jgi:hypothetical protein